MTTVGAWLEKARSVLDAAGVEESQADSSLLLRHVTGLTREGVFLERVRVLTPEEESRLESLLIRRTAREPVSRITGTRGFWKSGFVLAPDTLDPRADSEILIEAALASFSQTQPSNILDLGTGSGCLLLSLLQEFAAARGVGVDISPAAAEAAAKNARRLNLQGRAEFLARDWSDYHPEAPFDLVVSNPPYIPSNEVDRLEPEVLLHDPRRALDGGDDGLACYQVLAGLMPRFLAPQGLLLLEIGHDQAATVTSIFENAGFTVAPPIQDLGGRDRCLAARWRE